MSKLYIGQQCRANDAVGIIRFIGETKFAPGPWIGLELSSAIGKNDGSIQGERYFACPRDHGVFVRPTKVLPLPLNDGNTKETVIANTTAHSDGVFKIPVNRRAEQRTPSRLSRPLSRISIGSQASADGLPKYDVRNIVKTTSQDTQALRASNTLSEIYTTDRDAQSGAQNSRATTMRSTPTPSDTKAKFLENESVKIDDEVNVIAQGFATSLTPQNSMNDANITEIDQKLKDPTTDTIIENEKLKKLITDLKRKLIALESLRSEDLSKLSNLGALESEKEAWVTIRTKLRDKLQSQQQEIRGLRERIGVLEVSLNAARISSDDGQNSTSEALEMATLDREMAEEERDQIKLEMAEQKSRMEELTLELEILKEQAAEVSDPASHSASESRAIELQNDRLREALLRLKEITNEQEISLNSSNKENDELMRDLQETRSGLETSQAQVILLQQITEDLKDQVDISIGAEDMLESLTERNLVLGEQVEKYRAEIADLEALKELNDELDENHSQAQKELVEELGLQQSVIDKQTHRLVMAEKQESHLLESIRKFRGQISTLQAEVANLQTSEQGIQVKNSKMSDQIHDLQNKNTDLQIKDSRASVNLLEINLKRHEAMHALEHLDIVREYVPQMYADDQKAIETYVTLKSMAGLCRLLFDHFQARIGSTGSEDPYRQGSINLVLLQIASLLHQCLSKIVLSTPEMFLQFALMADEFCSLKGALIAVVDGVKNNSTDEIDVVAKLQNLYETISTIALLHDNTQETQDVKFCLWSLEAVCLTSSSMIRQVTKLSEDSGLAPDDSHTSITGLASISGLLNKLHAPLKKYISQDDALETIVVAEAATTSTDLVERLCDILRTVLQLVKHAIIRVDDDNLDHLTKLVADLEHKIDEMLPQIENFLFTMAPKQSRNQVSSSQALTSPDRNLWRARAQRNRAQGSVDDESQLQIRRLEQDLQNIMLSLHMKGKQLEEEEFKVSALERRLLEHDSMKATINALEANDRKHISDRKTYEDAIEELNDQLEILQERIDLAKHTKENPLPTSTNEVDQVSQEEIRVLRKTVGHLSQKLAKAQSSESSKYMQFLKQPLLPDQKRALAPRPSCYDKAVLEFYGQVKFVDFRSSPLTSNKWTPMKEKCGYIHYVQEEAYAHLWARKFR